MMGGPFVCPPGKFLCAARLVGFVLGPAGRLPRLPPFPLQTMRVQEVAPRLRLLAACSGQSLYQSPSRGEDLLRMSQPMLRSRLLFSLWRAPPLLKMQPLISAPGSQLYRGF